MIFNKRILSYIPPKGTPYEMGKQVLPAILAKGEKFYGYECEEYSKGIDTIEKWKEVERYLKDNNYQA
jgi:NDP-sugar pyrophosphorylase family protein